MIAVIAKIIMIIYHNNKQILNKSLQVSNSTKDLIHWELHKLLLRDEVTMVTWCRAVFIALTEWTLAIILPWWHCHWYYYCYYYYHGINCTNSMYHLPGGPPCSWFPLRGPSFCNTGNINLVIQWSLLLNGFRLNPRWCALLSVDGKRSLYSMVDCDVLDQTDGILLNTTPARTFFALPAVSWVCRKSCTIADSLENPTVPKLNTQKHEKHLLCQFHSVWH